MQGAVGLFYFTTLEEYYVGGLHLKPGNGVTDGSFGVIVLLLSIGIMGNDIVNYEFIKDNEYTRFGSLAAYICIAIYICTFLTNCYNIAKKPSDSEIGEKVVFKDALLQGFLYFSIIGLL